MRKASLLAALAASWVAGSTVVGCVPATRGYCEAAADCDKEFLGVDIPDDAGDSDDSVAVCQANQDGRLRALRANEEEECHAVAAALEAYYTCVAAEFADSGDGCDAIQDDCDSEFDDVQDALSDVNGDECTSSEE